MGPRPWNPSSELDGALQRGDLDFAITLATEVGVERGRPIDLARAARLLPLVARQRPADYSAWAMRWLVRWATEAPGATIENAADVAAALADLPTEPARLEDLLRDVAAPPDNGRTRTRPVGPRPENMP